MKGSKKNHPELPYGASSRRALQRVEGEKCSIVHDEGADSRPVQSSRLVYLRHHASLWLVPAALLVAALFPWPYGYYDLLRLVVCAGSGWIAFEQWRHDDAISGWVVAFGATALLYNPILAIHLTREIWTVFNIVTATLFVGHLATLRRLMANGSKARSRPSPGSLKGIAHKLRELPRWSGRGRLPRR